MPALEWKDNNLTQKEPSEVPDSTVDREKLLPSDIIDNRHQNLADAIKGKFKGAKGASFAVGYLFVSGLRPFLDELKAVSERDGFELRLLIGNSTDLMTVETLAASFQNEDELREVVARTVMFPGREERKKRLEETEKGVEKGISLMPQSRENEELIRVLSELISKEKLKIRVYTKERLHSKAYIFDYLPEIVKVANETGASFVGSSNLSLSGIKSNTELNVQVHGNENHRALKEWFNRLWKEAEPFDSELMEILKKSWALNIVSPFELYYRTLAEIVRKFESEENDPGIRYRFPKLAEFQADAVKRALSILEKYNGVFISDVVGLGKTYIGLTLLKHYTTNKRQSALVFCPASLVRMWEEKCEEYQVDAKVISTGMLSRGNFDINKYRNRSVVLIDESHHFRHPDNIRYQTIAPFCATRKVILLTATPQNKEARDIYNQIKLFHPNDRTELPIDPPNIAKFFRLVEKRERNLRELLRHLLIRRTRSHILQYYAKQDNEFSRKYIEINGKRNYFPERRLETVDYSIDSVYSGVYDRILDGIKEMNYTRYCLGAYVKPDKQGLREYRELNQTSGVLRGLVRSLLFKRFESSVEAFRKTVERMINSHRLFAEGLNRGFVALGEDASRIIKEFNENRDIEDVMWEMKKASERYNIEDFEVDEIKKDLSKDIAVLEELERLVQRISLQDDDKLQNLRKLLRERIGREKVLIFTEYEDTAKYLEKGLEDFRDLAVVTGSTDNQMEVIRRFSPRSNPDFRPLRGRELQIVVATDVLSEGLNLQDCSRVVNYDLHWNHVRLIQRIGRVDRIGSEAEKIFVYNFLPERKLDQNLGLKERLQERIREFNRALGNDSRILEESEEINPEAMYAIYRGDIEEVEKESERNDPANFSDIPELARRYHEMKDRAEGIFSRIEGLPYGIRARDPKKEKGGFAFFKYGDYEMFYLSDEDGRPGPVDMEVALRAIYVSGEGRFYINEPERNTGDFRIYPPIPDRHIEFVKSAQRHFRDFIEKRENYLMREAGMTVEQEYIRNELSALIKEEEDEERKEALREMLQVILRPQGRGVQRELRRLRRNQVTGVELSNAVWGIIREHNLDREREGDEAEEKGEPIRLVTSEAFGGVR